MTSWWEGEGNGPGKGHQLILQHPRARALWLEWLVCIRTPWTDCAGATHQEKGTGLPGVSEPVRRPVLGKSAVWAEIGIPAQWVGRIQPGE